MSNYAKAFSPNFKRNEGFTLWLQQVTSLIVKRFYIFYRRFILAIVVLLFPLLLEAILTALLPSQSTLQNSIKRQVSSQSNYSLSITNNAPIILPYTLSGSYSSSMMIGALFVMLNE